MKRVRLNEKSYNRLKNKLVNEISYDTVSRASDRSYEVFNAVISSFEDFYDNLKEAMLNVKYHSEDGQQDFNPYLNKVKELSDIIYDILNQKEVQKDMFNQELNKVDYKKFYNSKEGEENDMDDMDLRYLQNNYPKD